MEHPSPTFRCPSCGGAAHPASGCQYSKTVVVCGPCTRRFWVWFRAHNNKRYGVVRGVRGSGVNFYDHVIPVEEERAHA